MTATNALVTADAGYLMTDTAIYDQAGIVCGFSTKVTTFPHLNMAFSTSGANEHHATAKGAFMTFASFDDAAEGIGDRLREMWEDGRFERRFDGTDSLRLLIVGWSSRSRSAELYGISSEPEPDCDPFVLTRSYVAINPGTNQRSLAEAGLLVDGKPVGSDPEDWLTRLIDVQRQRPSAPRGTPDTYERPSNADHLKFVVGGHAVLTKVGRHGITQRVVRRWNDAVDAFIEPSKEVEHEAS